MRLGPANELDQHANAIRRRLDELHKRLKIASRSMSIFTKMDLVAGFHGVFRRSQPRTAGNGLGHDVPAQEKTDNMVTEFRDAEYDELMRALSEQMTDRLQIHERPARAVPDLAFPTQMASLKGQINEFLVKVFEPSRYRVDVALRGFYFTSGTQEGNPIDRVLGALSRNFGTQGGMVPIFSGQGRSFFLKDLLQKVIFEEAGWVSTNLSHMCGARFS